MLKFSVNSFLSISIRQKSLSSGVEDIYYTFFSKKCDFVGEMSNKKNIFFFS